MFKMKSPLHNHIKWLKFALLSLLTAMLAYPILLIFLIPISIYRLLVKTVVKFTDSKCGEMLIGISSYMTGPDPYNQPIGILSLHLLFSEKVDISLVKKIINEKVIKENLFPETKQRIVKRFGYYFWRNVDDFDLDNHIKYLNPENPDIPVLKCKLREEISDKVVFRKFDKRYSPWEIFIVPNVFDPENPSTRSAIFFRANHCMMDGLSIVKFFQKTASKQWNWPMAKAFAKNSGKLTVTNLLRSIQTAIELILTGPYLLISKVFVVNDTSEFINAILQNPKDKSAIQWTKKKNDPRCVDVEMLHRIRQKHKVGMSSVVTTIVADGVSKFIRKKCRSGFSDEPKEFILHFVVPLPRHPDGKCANHWSFIRLPIVLSQCTDPVATAKRIHSMYQKLATSVEPIVNKLLFDIIAVLPNCLQPPPDKSNLQQTVLLSNFPGPKDDVEVFGYNCVAWSVLGSSPMNTAIVIAVQTLAGKFWIDAGGVNTIFPEQGDLLLIEDCLHSVVKDLDQ